jgi:GT2 family glycosyltransferase
MNLQRPKVSVIVISLNGEKVIGACLESLLKTDYSPLELIVVNNGSTDSTPEIVKNRFPSVKLINLPYNHGFAGGNNVGLKAAEGEILILLNDDTTVEPQWVTELVIIMQLNPSVGIAGCKLYYPDGKTLQHAGGYINQHGLSNHYGKGEIDKGQCDTLREVDYVTGAAFAIRKELLHKLGYLDTRYHPIYFEETDYCFRARKLGYRVVYVPKSIVCHYESQNTGLGSASFFYKYHKNRIRFLLRNFSAEQLAQAIEPELKWLWSVRNGPEFKPCLKAHALNLLRFPLLLWHRWSGEFHDWKHKSN